MQVDLLNLAIVRNAHVESVGEFFDSMSHYGSDVGNKFLGERVNSNETEITPPLWKVKVHGVLRKSGWGCPLCVMQKEKTGMAAKAADWF